MKSQIDWERLGPRAKRRKGDVPLAQGEVVPSLFYVETGLLKAVYVTADGKEVIKSFLQEGDLVGSLGSCVSGEPSPFALVCMEDSVLIEIDFAALRALTETDARAAGQALSMLMALALKKERREFEFLCLSAEERLEALVKRSPGLVNRIKQQDLARYLGITPVALSRIRRRGLR